MLGFGGIKLIFFFTLLQIYSLINFKQKEKKNNVNMEKKVLERRVLSCLENSSLPKKTLSAIFLAVKIAFPI